MENNIYQRINAVRKKIGYVQKDKSVPTGQSGSYKAVTHDAVTGQIRQFLIEEGVVIVPTLVKSLANPFPVGADMVREKQFRYEATYAFTFKNVDVPEDCFTVEMEAHACDNQDKAPGKCLSYAKKMVVLKVFELQTGEDEESRYQQSEYDYSDALNKAEAATSAELALAILAEAKKHAIDTKDRSSLEAIKAVSKKLSVKFQGEPA
jgi:hypothetical protein